MFLWQEPDCKPCGICQQVDAPYVADRICTDRRREEGVIMASKKPMTPGTKAPSSGQGLIIGPRGGNTHKEVTIVKGHKVPPTPKPGQKIVMVDPTKNGAGKGK